MTKHRAWLFLIVGVFLLVIVDRVYIFNLPAHSVYENSQKTEKPKDKEQSTSSPMLAVVANIEDFIEAHEKLFIVLATIALAWFTFTLWRATDGLFVMARKQAEDMRTSLAIAEKSATAAQTMVSTMEDTSKRQLRAYIGLAEIGFIRVGYFRIIVANNGQTPAHQMTIWRELCNDPPKSYTYSAPLVAKQMLHPSQVYEVRDLPQECLYIYGRFVYQDIFERWWATKFCHFMEPSAKFVPWGEYNKEDGPYKTENDALNSI